MAGHVVLNGAHTAKLPGEPILDEVDWQELGQMTRERSPGHPPSDTYLCTGIVRCGNCGGRLTGRPYSRNNPNVRFTYECRRRKGAKGASGCGKTIGERDNLDTFIRELAFIRLSSPEHATQLAETARRRTERLRPHEKELARLLKLRAYWDKQLLDGDCDEARHSQMATALKAKIRAEEEKIAKLGGAKPAAAAEESIEEIRAAWNAYGVEKRREMLMQAFEGYNVYVTPGPVNNLDYRGRVQITPLPADEEE